MRTPPSRWPLWMKWNVLAAADDRTVMCPDHEDSMTQAAAKSDVRLKRAYYPPSPEDGARVLVDRLWPRGVRKADAAIDRWAKEVAPSTELRRWFGHDPSRWEPNCRAKPPCWPSFGRLRARGVSRSSMRRATSFTTKPSCCATFSSIDSMSQRSDGQEVRQWILEVPQG